MDPRRPGCPPGAIVLRPQRDPLRLPHDIPPLRRNPPGLLLTRMQLMAQYGELEIAEGCLYGEQLQRELIYLRSEKTGESDDLAMALGSARWKARVRCVQIPALELGHDATS